MPLLMSVTCDRPAMVRGRFYRFYRLFVDVFSSWTFLPWTLFLSGHYYRGHFFLVDVITVDVITEHRKYCSTVHTAPVCKYHVLDGPDRNCDAVW